MRFIRLSVLLLLLIFACCSCSSTSTVKNNEKSIGQDSIKTPIEENINKPIDQANKEVTNIETKVNIVVNNFFLGQYHFKDVKYKISDFQNDMELPIDELTKEYNVYSNGSVSKHKPNRIDENRARECIFFDDLKNPNYVALSKISFDPYIRPYKIKGATEECKHMIGSILKNNSFSKAPIIINRVIEVDMDGDGLYEEIIEASNAIKYNDTLKVSEKKLKSYKETGLYELIILNKDTNPIVLWEHYMSIEDNYYFEITDELVKSMYENADDEEDARARFYFPEDCLYLYDKDGDVSLYRPYEFDYGGESGCYSHCSTVEIMDIDNDKLMEIILYEDGYFDVIQIIKFKDDRLFTIEAEYLGM